MRKIRIANISFFIICISSAVAVTFSMTVGRVIGSFFSERITSFLGAIILISVGLWILLQNFIHKLNNKLNKKRYMTYDSMRVMEILQEPVKADINESGEIDIKEAFLLGTALAMDALAAGLGAAMTGYSPLVTPVFVAGIQFILVKLGIMIGKKISVFKLKEEASWVPGGIIILLGLTKLTGL
jgi:putative sporulation protein YtaF